MAESKKKISIITGSSKGLDIFLIRPIDVGKDAALFDQKSMIMTESGIRVMN